MSLSSLKKPFMILGVFVAMWLAVRYLLPAVFPFVLGAGLAVAAEPMVHLAQSKLRLPRGAAVGVGVTLMLVFLVGALSLAGALVVKEASRLTGVLPKLANTAQQGALLLEDWLVGTVQRAPDNLRVPLTNTVLDFFDGGSALMQQAAQRLPGAVSKVLSWVPDGVLGLGTGLLAGFMISYRLPRLKKLFTQRLPKSWYEKYLPALQRVRYALSGWLKAQLKLSAVTFLVVSVGFLLLSISYAPVWAALVALVDAVPLLGTGTVLVPWAVVCFLQGETARAVGLLALYAVALVLRTVLEPKLVGRQLGLDPLLTLAALYLGYRFWGILGMLVTPILAAAAKSVFSAQPKPDIQQ